MATSSDPYFELLLGAIEKFDRSETVAVLSENVSKLSCQLGYEYAAYIAGPIPNKTFKDRLLLSTWPPGWVEQYSQPGWNQKDRVAHALRARKNVFRWSDVQIANNDHYARRVMQTAFRDFGMRVGLCVPIHGQAGYKSGFSFGGFDADQSEKALRVLQLAAVYAVDRFSSLDEAKTRVHLLTPREREVMKWVAVGKTAWDIGEILNIAEDTVNKIAKSAMAKLNAQTRAQAVAEAIRVGEIAL
jgi:LuxR family quorum sensing-dependent transcriptional regulator